MSDQWVDQQGMMRNSSGRYPTGQRSYASIEGEEDDKAFEIAKDFSFEPVYENIWGASFRPKLAAILTNKKMPGAGYEYYYVGIEIEHAILLRKQLDDAITAWKNLTEDKSKVRTKKLADAAGMTITEKPVIDLPEDIQNC